MKLEGNSILITGGSSGIGFGFAEYFSKHNKVIICGKDKKKLDSAKKKIPSLITYACDLSKKEECEGLYNWINKNHKDVNILINNAGIQREIDIKKGVVAISVDEEIDVNLKSPIYLSLYFTPMLSAKPNSAIINISSGLAFIPLAAVPIYCATKAAIHSFTVSLRRQLKTTSIKVIEVIPPIVHDTNLKGKPIERNERSISTVELINEVITALREDKEEIPAGLSRNMIAASKNNFYGAFEDMNRFLK